MPFFGSSMLMASTSLSVPPGEAVFPVEGVFDWTVPEGVFSISAVVIGGGGGGGRTTVGTRRGGGGGGGGLSYVNLIPVTPGEVLTVQVGSGGTAFSTGSGNSGTQSFIRRGATSLVYAGGGGRGTGPATNADGAGGAGGAGGTATGADGGSPGRAGVDGGASVFPMSPGGAGDYDGTPQASGDGTDVYGSSTPVANGPGAGGRGGNSSQTAQGGRSGRVRIVWGGLTYPGNALLPA